MAQSNNPQSFLPSFLPSFPWNGRSLPRRPALHSPLPPPPPPILSHKSAAIKRQRKAAAPLGDVTNLLLPETPTPIKPTRTGLRPLPTPSDASSTASVTPVPKPSSAKGKEPVAAAAGTASCPPLGKATRNNTRKDSMAQDTRPISSSAPCHGAKKKRPPPNTPKLPEDFVKKQRAYFADVDAFELPVEEVSESELE